MLQHNTHIVLYIRSLFLSNTSRPFSNYHTHTYTTQLYIEPLTSTHKHTHSDQVCSPSPPSSHRSSPHLTFDIVFQFIYCSHHHHHHSIFLLSIHHVYSTRTLTQANWLYIFPFSSHLIPFLISHPIASLIVVTLSPFYRLNYIHICPHAHKWSPSADSTLDSDMDYILLPLYTLLLLYSHYPMYVHDTTCC